MQNFVSRAMVVVTAVMHFFTDKSLDPKQRKQRAVFGIVVALVIISILNAIIGGVSSLFGGSSEASTEQSAPKEPEAPREGGADAPDNEAYAAEINEAALDELGIDEWTEACLWENNVHWPCLVMDMESDSPDDLTVMLMMNADDPDAERLAKEAADGLLTLVGKEHGLGLVQIVDSGFQSMAIVHYEEAIHG